MRIELPIATVKANALRAIEEGRLQLQVDPKTPTCSYAGCCVLGASMTRVEALWADARPLLAMLDCNQIVTDDPEALLRLQEKHDDLCLDVTMGFKTLPEAVAELKELLST